MICVEEESGGTNEVSGKMNEESGDEGDAKPITITSASAESSSDDSSEVRKLE